MANMACTSRTRAASCSFLAWASRSGVPVPWRVARAVAEGSLSPGSPSSPTPGMQAQPSLPARPARRDPGRHAHRRGILDTRAPSLGRSWSDGLVAATRSLHRRNYPHLVHKITEPRKSWVTACGLPTPQGSGSRGSVPATFFHATGWCAHGPQIGTVAKTLPGPVTRSGEWWPSAWLPGQHADGDQDSPTGSPPPPSRRHLRERAPQT